MSAVNPNYVLSSYVKLSEQPASFQVVGARKEASFPQGIGWVHTVAADSWITSVTQQSTFLVIHWRGKWLHHQRDTRRASTSGRIEHPERPSSPDAPPPCASSPYRIIAEHVQAHRNSNYGILKLAPACGVEAVSKAFRQMALRTHPDKLPDCVTSNATLSAEAKVVFDLISRAHVFCVREEGALEDKQRQKEKGEACNRAGTFVPRAQMSREGPSPSTSGVLPDSCMRITCAS